MNIKNLTAGQKSFLYDSLKRQYLSKRAMTIGERKCFFQLREFHSNYLQIFGTDVLISYPWAKEINKDTFGEDYRSKWTKIKESGKGQFFYSAYQGKRIYLNEL